MEGRTAPLYRARLTIERVEFVFADSSMTVDERNILTTDTLEVTTSDPHTSLEQLLALGAVKLEKGALVVSFVEKPAEPPTLIHVPELKDDDMPTAAEVVDGLDKYAPRDASSVQRVNEAKRRRGLVPKRPVPYAKPPVLDDDDEDEDED